MITSYSNPFAILGTSEFQIKTARFSVVLIVPLNAGTSRSKLWQEGKKRKGREEGERGEGRGRGEGGGGERRGREEGEREEGEI